MRAVARIRNSPWAAYSFALGAVICYGSSSALAKDLIETYGPPLAIASFSHLFGGILVLSLVAKDLPRALKTPKFYLSMMFLAGSCAAGAVIALYFGLSKAPAIVVAPIVSVNPLITLILSHIFLKRMEQVTMRLIIGTCLIVGGVSLVVIGNATN